MSIRHIIWDWNGTLLDDLHAALQAVNTMLGRRGLPPLTRAAYREIFGLPVRPFYIKAGFVLENEDWDALAREFHTLFLADSSIRLYPQVPALLAELGARGISHSLLSVSKQSILDTLTRRYGIENRFDRIRGVDNLNGISKMDLGRDLLRELPFPPQEILMVGDTLHDAEVACGLGLPCLLVAAGHQSEKRLRSSGFPVIGSLDEIPVRLGHASPVRKI